MMPRLSAIVAISLDSPSNLRVIVIDTWPEQPEDARDRWLQDIAAAFRQVRTDAGIPADEQFMPIVRVYSADGGMVAEAWRARLRHYR